MIPSFVLITSSAFRRLRANDQKRIIAEAREWAGVRLGIPNPSNVAERLDVLAKHKYAFWDDRSRDAMVARQRGGAVQTSDFRPRPVFSKQHPDPEGQARVNAVFDTFPPLLWRLTRCGCDMAKDSDVSNSAT